ncbi:uncharacterized protein Triagg1_91 [Trichoderma aggressivum f. europaeum]|uniref:Uncharacterized protein n=1 Tax=Trichoderma aggressivum f. europaeum TaxID=173218 RepID=A0AAE1IJS6_9HYPO|nr:hypothetical protein Triagg1_91 [Trichoderma aggressivum f. europaeum]
MQPAPVPDGANPVLKSQVYQTGAKGVDQTQLHDVPGVASFGESPISSVRFLRRRREMADLCAAEFGYTRVSKEPGEMKCQAGSFQSSQDPQPSEPNMHPYVPTKARPLSPKGQQSPRPTPTPKQKHIFREVPL